MGRRYGWRGGGKGKSFASRKSTPSSTKPLPAQRHGGGGAASTRPRPRHASRKTGKTVTTARGGGKVDSGYGLGTSRSSAADETLLWDMPAVHQEPPTGASDRGRSPSAWEATENKQTTSTGDEPLACGPDRPRSQAAAALLARSQPMNAFQGSGPSRGGRFGAGMTSYHPRVDAT